MVERIRSKGFRKWSEGRLVESHLHLITTFLCLIAVLGAIEQGGPYNAWDKTAWLLLVTVGLGSLGAWCWHRYFAILQVAEFLVSRADCPHCAAYAPFHPGRHQPAAGRRRPGGGAPDAGAQCGLPQVRHGLEFVGQFPTG